MPNFFPKRPFFGSTDWGAQQFLRLLDREDRVKAEMNRLETRGWNPDPGFAMKIERENPNPDPGFAIQVGSLDPNPGLGDGHDVLAYLVQADLAHCSTEQ